MPEKNKVSLIVECNYSSSFELRILREQGRQQPANFNTYFRVEVVENELRDVFGCDCMVFDIFLELEARKFKYGKHAFEVSDEEFIGSVVVPQDHDVSVIEGFGMLVDFFQFHVGPRVVVDVVENHHEFSKAVINLFRRLY